MLIDEFGQEIDKKILDKNIIFFGASSRNIKVIEEFEIQDRVLFFVDSDERKADTKLGNYAIKSIDCLAEKRDCAVISVLIELPYFEQVLECVKKYNLQCFFYVPEKFDIKKSITVNWAVGGKVADDKLFDIENVSKNNLEILEQAVQYKYIHIFPNEKFFRPFYEMIEERMNISEHLFIIDYCVKGDIYRVLREAERKNAKNHNVLIFNDVSQVFDDADVVENCNLIFKDKRMQNLFCAADKIFLHSVMCGKSMKNSLAQWADEFGYKMVWMCWGGDSYYSKDYMIVSILQKVGQSYSALECVDRIQQNYGIQAKIFKIAGYAYVSCTKTSDINKKEEDYKYILLGHSATGYGNLSFGLDLLYQWRDKNIKIYCPLSYGSASLSYRDSVIKQGKDMFGDKFIPLIDFMEFDQYYAFLDNIDVAVSPVTAMVGVTTLAYLSTNNKKIYLRQELLKSYKDIGIYAENIELIRRQSFEEFFKVKNHVQGNFNDIIVETWIKVFQD